MQDYHMDEYQIDARGKKRQKTIEYKSEEKKNWEEWYLQKQYHYSCSEDEFLLILKIMTNNNNLADIIHNNYYQKSKDRKSRYKLYILVSTSFSSSFQSIIPCQGHYSNILQLSFLYESSGLLLSYKELATSSESLVIIAKNMKLSISLLIKIILWNLFKEILFNIRSITIYKKLNPILQCYIKTMLSSSYTHGEIKVSSIYKLPNKENIDEFSINNIDEQKLKKLLCQFEHKPAFIIPGVLFPQHLGQMDLEDIDWKSIIKLFPNISIKDIHLFIQMIRMFGSIFYSCNIPVNINESSIIEFCHKEVT